MKRWTMVVLSVLCVGFAAAASAQTLRVTDDRSNVRDSASTDGAFVVGVSRSDGLDGLDRSGSWYRRVKSAGGHAYVNAAVVETAVATNTSSAEPADPQPQAAKPIGPTPVKDRKFFVRPFAGLWTGYYTNGFGGGLGVASRPFSVPELELEIDVDAAHQSFDTFRVLNSEYSLSANLVQGSGNVLYNFKLPSSRFTPFAGGGLQYSHEWVSYPDIPGCRGCYDGYGFDGVGFQLIGGIDLPINDSRAWRFQFRAGNGLMLLGGLSF